MDYSSLAAGDISPIVALPVPDTCAVSYICGEDLLVPIYIVPGTGFEIEAVSEGQIDIAIEKQGSMLFFLLRFITIRQTSYIMATFDALNTPTKLSFARVMQRFLSPDGVALRIWTQDESSIIQTIRHTRLPANLQDALMPIIKRQMKRGRPVEFYEGMKLMHRFFQRTERTSLAFDRAEIRGRVS